MFIVWTVLMILTPWAIERLIFDETYPGFHGYDVDIGMTIRSMGMRVVVADIETHHHTIPIFKSDAVEREWYSADQRYRQKWGF